VREEKDLKSIKDKEVSLKPQMNKGQLCKTVIPLRKHPEFLVNNKIKTE